MARLWITTVILGLALAPLTACQPPDAQRPEAQPSDPLTTTDPTSPPAPNTPGKDADGLVIPGQRVGPVTAQTSRADLVELYGEAALDDRPIFLGEGTTELGTVVNADSDQQFAVVWDDAAQTRPRLIKDFGPAWQIPEGLGVGAPYAAVEAALGNFEFYGFAWDYGGTIVLDGTGLSQYDGELWLRLAPSDEAVAAHLDAYHAVMGDELFVNTNPNLAVLDLSVYEMVVAIKPEP
ncbi:hypothetical protein VB780_27430 [Leptolyngbya sp. CCNP1308]|uniref:hypothetical protein n=1 Tax=Leptolyngbya sp. CCNP1308 TaxID=3110255 RepID=UPI002B20E7D8|nr:hypothetical protein [Leptolyngbya sp. CCNP1308]MEA5452336.1 hypothetical protein [Leptolyngbya sp. CCNP1308]